MHMAAYLRLHWDIKHASTELVRIGSGHALLVAVLLTWWAPAGYPRSLSIRHMLSSAQQFQGELTVRHVHLDVTNPPASSSEVDTQYVLTPISSLPPLYLAFNASTLIIPTDLRTGMLVQVLGTLDANFNTILVQELVVLQGSDNKEYVAPGEQLRVTSITYIINICGRTAVDVNAFKSQWTNDGPTATPGSTMQDYYSQCSYNKTVFLPQDNVVVGPINLGCSGTTSWGATWSVESGQCGDAELYGWSQAADAWTRAQTTVNPSKFKRQLMILPMMPGCGWAGLASVGCGSTCFTWIQGGYAMSLDTVFHELGHNLGLQHSGTPSNEYGDCSCAMGGCTGRRCFSAPQMWRLGWALPLATLDKTSTPLGSWKSYVLPATQSSPGPGAPGATTSTAAPPSDRNLLRITSNWQPAGQQINTFYVSYRRQMNADLGLSFAWLDRVYIHLYNGDLKGSSPLIPRLLLRLTPGQEYIDSTGANLKIRHDASVQGMAIVRVCRFNLRADECAADGVVIQGNNCGDGVCALDETGISCPADCLPKPPPPRPPSPPPPPPFPPRPPFPPHSPPFPPPMKPAPPSPPGPAQPPHPPESPSPPPPPPPPPPFIPDPPSLPSGPDCPCTSHPSPPLGIPDSQSPPASSTTLATNACITGRALCGDSFCDAWAGENCRTCPQDCKGRSLNTSQPYCCGEGAAGGCGDWRCTQRLPVWLFCRADCSSRQPDSAFIASGDNTWEDLGSSATSSSLPSWLVYSQTQDGQRDTPSRAQGHSQPVSWPALFCFGCVAAALNWFSHLI